MVARVCGVDVGPSGSRPASLQVYGCCIEHVMKTRWSLGRGVMGE